MTVATFSPAKLINLITPNSIWEHLDPSETIKYFWLGRQSYRTIWELQKQLHRKRVAGKIPDLVLFLEHLVLGSCSSWKG